MSKRQVTKQVTAIGTVDWDRRLFDEIVETPDGTTYNSYLLTSSEKTAMIDTVDERTKDEFLQTLSTIQNLDYLIVQHAEQDHTGCIEDVVARFPHVEIVCNKLCHQMLLDEWNLEHARFKIIEDGEELSLGDMTLQFVFTPWVHWPETMCTFYKEERLLFTCDFFGSHFATADLFLADPTTIYQPMKRYYAEIMMPFANIIKKNLEKVRALDVATIAPSHGPLHPDPEIPLGFYESWVSPQVEPKVVALYVSNHGSTKKIMDHAVTQIHAKGLKVQEFNVTVASTAEIAMALVDASMLLVASPTFLSSLHPVLAQKLLVMNALRPKTKLIGYIGSNEWGGHVEEDFVALTKQFSKAKRLESLMIKGAPTQADFKQIDHYVDTIFLEHELLDSQLLSKLPAQKTLQTRPKSVSIVIAGAAGQGLQSLQRLLSDTFKEEGLYVFSTKEYESRIRGGSNSVTLRISNEPVHGFVEKIDIFLPLDSAAVKHCQERLSSETIVLGDKQSIDAQDCVDIPFLSLAKEIGNKVYANTIAMGVILGMFQADKHIAYRLIKKRFAHKDPSISEKNIQAIDKGYALVKERSLYSPVSFTRDVQAKDTFFLQGAQSIAWGALAGGCNFISAYPMSPSTGVLNELAKQEKAFDIIVEQVEDEIAAVNMSVGAWYAGAKALVNTSGGGFALMCEGISLAAMMETPLVTHIAQRPGPATGLPTRTAQEDLNLALYAGHGEFARAIYAPGTVEEGFLLTKHAFEVADKYQVPTFILTDQYFMDTELNMPVLELPSKAPKHHIIETEENYNRYDLTENGITPRGIPGFGKGIVCVDSDEHDVTGHITESPVTRTQMVEKRMKRFELLQENALLPKRFGSSTASTLFISWGTTYGSIIEALEQAQRKDIAYLHFTQVYPLSKQVIDWLSQVRQIYVIENNATGQFAQLLQQHTSTLIKNILQYDGMPFSVESLLSIIEEVQRP